MKRSRISNLLKMRHLVASSPRVGRIITAMRYRCSPGTVLLVLLISASVVAVQDGMQPTLLHAASSLGEVKTKIDRSDERYQYGSKRFNLLLAESHSLCRTTEEHDFYRWMDEAYKSSKYQIPGLEGLSVEALTTAKKQELKAIVDKAKKADAEIEIGASLHKLIKTIIPRFSLDRGFEFCNVMKYGERQCFLQSVLIVGLLQDMGVDSGVVMVYKNIKGETSNNGHATVLVKLSDGRDIIVDASDPEPFAHQQGLFVRTTDYQYVEPIYEKSGDAITHYRASAGGSRIETSSVRTLDYNFVRSMFWYYRGERTTGGLTLGPKTKDGLYRSVRYLRASVHLGWRNPLAVYMLGRVYYALGDMTMARYHLRHAREYYTLFGYYPEGPREYYALIHKAKQSTLP